MAVGDGGFKTALNGFDKNEVNAYISELRKKTKSMEDEMKASVRKAEEAEKRAEEADNRIKEAVREAESKAEELKKQLEEEQKKTSELNEKLSASKKELEQERRKMSDMLRSGKGVSAEAKRAYAEITDKADADAKEIIDRANEKAEEIIADAKNRCADTTEKTSAFLEVLRAQIEALGAGYKTISESAAEMLGADSVPAPEFTVPAPIAAPAPAAAAEEKPAAKEKPASKKKSAAKETPAEAENEPSLAELLAQAENAFGVKEEEDIVTEITAETPQIKIEASSEAMPGIEDAPAPGDAPAVFDDAWGGSELAQTIYNSEASVPLVNPNARNIFGEDIFGVNSAAEEEKKPEPEKPAEEPVSEIKPLDVSDISDASFDSGFDHDLLSQTMPSGSLGADVSSDLLEAVRAKEASFAVKPAQPDVSDLDMDEHEEEAPAASPEDELQKALRDMAAMMGNSAPAAEEDTSGAGDSDSSAGSDPWGDLQKQLEAMEQSGSFGTGDDSFAAAETVPAQPEEPAAPSADDSAIWDFGGSASDSDDDMSSDFGGFGGF